MGDELADQAVQTDANGDASGRFQSVTETYKGCIDCNDVGVQMDGQGWQDEGVTEHTLEDVARLRLQIEFLKCKVQGLQKKEVCKETGVQTDMSDEASTSLGLNPGGEAGKKRSRCESPVRDSDSDDEVIEWTLPVIEVPYGQMENDELRDEAPGSRPSVAPMERRVGPDSRR